jgi:cytochrome c biogenesis factor
LLASIGLWTALFLHDFSIKFVASYTSSNLPKIYTLTAFWAGQSGSMLFWALILTTYSAIAVFTNRKSNRAMMPYVTGTLGIICLFFLMTMCFGANPYERLDWIPPEGRGMNPQLQNPGMAIHPPMLYLGLVGTAIPFAFAIGALVPILAVLLSPQGQVGSFTTAAALGALAVLGGLSAKAGGAAMPRGVMRMVVWGSLALGLTALVGHLVGKAV